MTDAPDFSESGVDTPTPATPAPGAPPAPLAAGDAAARRPRFDARALLIAALVILAGAALGAAGFLFEQHNFVWHPTVTRVDGGWRIAGYAGLHMSTPVLRGNHLVWTQGPYTCILDLGSGDAKVIDVSVENDAAGSVVASDRYVAWVYSPRQQDGPSTLWAYDIARGRRWKLDERSATSSSYSGLAISGATLAIVDERSRIVGIDLSSGRRTVLASKAVTWEPMLGDGIVGWHLDGASDLSQQVALKDMRAGRIVTLELAPAGSDTAVGNIQLSGRRLLWARETGDSFHATLFVYDFDTARATAVAQGDVWTSLLSGERVIWAESLPNGSGATIVARDLTDGTGPVVELARVGSNVAALAADGSTMAWLGESTGGVSFIQTKRVPR